MKPEGNGEAPRWGGVGVGGYEATKHMYIMSNCLVEKKKNTGSQRTGGLFPLCANYQLSASQLPIRPLLPDLQTRIRVPWVCVSLATYFCQQEVSGKTVAPGSRAAPAHDGVTARRLQLDTLLWTGVPHPQRLCARRCAPATLQGPGCDVHPLSRGWGCRLVLAPKTLYFYVLHRSAYFLSAKPSRLQPLV